MCTQKVSQKFYLYIVTVTNSIHTTRSEQWKTDSQYIKNGMISPLVHKQNEHLRLLNAANLRKLSEKSCNLRTASSLSHHNYSQCSNIDTQISSDISISFAQAIRIPLSPKLEPKQSKVSQGYFLSRAWLNILEYVERIFTGRKLLLLLRNQFLYSTQVLALVAARCNDA